MERSYTKVGSSEGSDPTSARSSAALAARPHSIQFSLISDVGRVATHFSGVFANSANKVGRDWLA